MSTLLISLLAVAYVAFAEQQENCRCTLKMEKLNRCFGKGYVAEILDICPVFEVEKELGPKRMKKCKWLEKVMVNKCGMTECEDEEVATEVATEEPEGKSGRVLFQWFVQSESLETQLNKVTL